MTTFKQFKDIKAWQQARVLTRSIYGVTRDKPFNKDFALRDQIRKASISITSNIAEGFERDSTAEFLHFLSIAKGSAGEVRSQLYVALDEEYITKRKFNELQDRASEVSRIISGLVKYLKQCDHRGLRYK